MSDLCPANKAGVHKLYEAVGGEQVCAWCGVKPLARRTDPATSHEAAASMMSAAANYRQKILEALKASPMTGDEVDVLLFDGVNTAGRRLIELARLGLAERTDERRTTRSGRAAYVWRAL